MKIPCLIILIGITGICIKYGFDFKWIQYFYNYFFKKDRLLIQRIICSDFFGMSVKIGITAHYPHQCIQIGISPVIYLVGYQESSNYLAYNFNNEVLLEYYMNDAKKRLSCSIQYMGVLYHIDNIHVDHFPIGDRSYELDRICNIAVTVRQ